MSSKPTVRSGGPRPPGAGPGPSSQLQLHTVDGSGFDRRYDDLGQLGMGGMGEVRLCSDAHTDRRVALKRLNRDRLDDRSRRRFLREARVQAKLDHPVIVPVYDIGLDEEGYEYFTMKRAAGVTLAEVIGRLRTGDPEELRRYPLPTLLGVFRQVCQGVTYAHSRGVIHRDLKPENIVVGEFGQTFLLDWGIAKVATSSMIPPADREGGSGGPGTPGYMAPEQMEDGEAVDARADVYSLGAVLFEILTLEPLHPATSQAELVNDTLEGRDEVRISRRRPDLEVAPEVERACVEATQRDPRQRLAAVEDLLQVVGAYLDGDRDLAYRRSLAEGYTATAQATLTQLLTEGDPDDQLRVQALRAAGHAIALDPQADVAVDVVTTLLRTPPAKVPEEVASDIEKHEAARELAGARMGLVAYLTFILPLGFFTTHVTNWAAALWVLVPYVLAVVLVGLYAWRVSPRRPPVLLVDGMMLLTCSATCILLGPYILMPQLLTAFATGATMNTRAAVERARYWIPLCLLATAAPMALLALDLLPVEFTLTEPATVTVRHRISDLQSSGFVHTILVAVTLLSVMVPVLFAYGNAAKIRELRARLVLQMWQLKQLGSSQLQVNSSPPSRSPPPPTPPAESPVSKQPTAGAPTTRTVRDRSSP